MYLYFPVYFSTKGPMAVVYSNASSYPLKSGPVCIINEIYSEEFGKPGGCRVSLLWNTRGLRPWSPVHSYL